MPVGEFCNREVIVVGREAAAVEATRLMRTHHVGSLVVVDDPDGGRPVPVGIVTDRDLVVEIMATALDPKAITVGDIMRPSLATVRDSTELVPAIEVMRANGVRRLPVLDAGGALAGIIAIDDLLEVLVDQMRELTGVVAREQAREARERR